MAMSKRWNAGGCFCGELRYRVRGDAVWKAGCTCSSCQKIHAAPYVVWAGFNKTDFEYTRGTAKEFASSPHVRREFCPSCGTSVTYRKVAAGVPSLEAAARLIYIAVVSLDDPSLYPPDEIVHGQEKPAWMLFGDEIPVHQFISEEAGDLQFGGIAPELATQSAVRRSDDNR